MATLWIKEFETLPYVPGGPAQIWPEPATVEQAVSYTGTAGTSAAFNAKTKYIAITSGGIFSYLVSTAGTAAQATNYRVPADQILVFGVKGGDSISAITNT